MAALNSMMLTTKIQTEFWNSKNFLRNGWEMNAQWTQNEVQLSSDFFQRVKYSLIPNAVTFRNNRFINIPYMPRWDPGMKYKAYDVSSPTNTIFRKSSDQVDD